MCDVLATFMGLVIVILAGLLVCKAYLDDMVVCSESQIENLEHLGAMFCHLKEAGVIGNLS